MIASMTGYGRAEQVFDDYRVIVEISTVNNRFLDFQIRIPRTLSEIEQNIKRLLSTRLHRGKVNFSLVIEDSIQASGRLVLNTETADMYQKILNDIKTRFSIDDKINLEHFVNLPDLIKAETSEINQQKIWQDVEPVCINALDELCRMRLAEGKNLQADFEKRIKLLSENVSQIKNHSGNNIEMYRDKLQQRVQELLTDFPVDNQRIAMEASLAAEKMDITEETVRFESHIDSFKNAIEHEGAVGKRLTFILQEMHREANTMSSKASDYQISSLVINIKDDLEKLREQALNIE